MPDRALAQESSPKAFVLSPIDPEFDEVYRQLIRPALEQEGFEVGRADELDLQNIMNAVIHGIQSATLIVAEITSRNPNVMYELGIAHALEKPVVMLTQDIQQVPFDLRAYRVIKYSPHFAEVASLTASLKELAAAAREGSLVHSSPVSDFARSRGSYQTDTDTGQLQVTDEEPELDESLGLFDHLVSNSEDFEELTAGTVALGEATESIGARLVDRTEEIKKAAGSSGSGRSARMLAVLRRSSNDLFEYTEALEAYERLLTDLVPRVGRSLLGIVELAPITDESQQAEASELLGVLESLGATVGEGVEGMRSMRDALDQIRNQKMSRDMSRAAVSAVRVMDSIFDHLSALEADLGRGAAVIEQRLEEGNQLNRDSASGTDDDPDR